MQQSGQIRPGLLTSGAIARMTETCNRWAQQISDKARIHAPDPFKPHRYVAPLIDLALLSDLAFMRSFTAVLFLLRCKFFVLSCHDHVHAGGAAYSAAAGRARLHSAGALHSGVDRRPYGAVCRGCAVRIVDRGVCRIPDTMRRAAPA
jgi:hypothetical protein